jgi:hypothetical protein
LIDLAGSEKASENVDRRKEARHINQSLLTLGKVISKLTSNESCVFKKNVLFCQLLIVFFLEPFIFLSESQN